MLKTLLQCGVIALTLLTLTGCIAAVAGAAAGGGYYLGQNYDFMVKRQ